MSNFCILNNMQISFWVYVLLGVFIWVGFLLLVKRVFFGRIKKFSMKTNTQIDDVLLDALDFPLTLLIFVSAIFVLQKMFPMQNNVLLAKYFMIAFRCVLVVSIVLFVDKFLRGLVRLYSPQVEILKTSGVIVQVIIRGVVFGLGSLILLDSFGVSITPIIASLGISSLAVALALQPTLENFFSGIQLVSDKSIQPGQFIKLDSGEEGYVHKIGWRSSWIKLPTNNIVVIPNKILVNSKVLNYHYPKKEANFTVDLGVDYNSDLEKVEHVTLEVAEGVMKSVPGGVETFKPVVRFNAFSESSINLTVVLSCREISDSSLLRHEFIKRIKKKYAQEGIEIPYPVRVIKTKQLNTNFQ